MRGWGDIDHYLKSCRWVVSCCLSTDLALCIILTRITAGAVSVISQAIAFKSPLYKGGELHGLRASVRNNR